MATVELTLKSLEGRVDPDWCPGCGDFGVLKSLKEAIVELKIQPHNVLVVSGIGCSSNLPGFINAYGVHSLHGRALPVATGAALANHDLHVVAVGGDGDGFGIGMGHFIHAMAWHRWQESQELFAAPAHDHVGLAQDLGQAGRDRGQHRVARRVAVGVVDMLEVVDVEQEQRADAVRPGR